MSRMRPFLEQRGVAERWRDGKRVDTQTYQIMVDLEDHWPSFTSPDDMVSRLAPLREAHDRAYAEHKRPPRPPSTPSWALDGWFDRILWSSPTLVRYNLRSSKQVEPCLSPAEQKAQGARCGCMGADDYCVCQNVPDRETRRLRAGGAG